MCFLQELFCFSGKIYMIGITHFSGFLNAVFTHFSENFRAKMHIKIRKIYETDPLLPCYNRRKRRKRGC